MFFCFKKEDESEVMVMSLESDWSRTKRSCKQTAGMIKETRRQEEEEELEEETDVVCFLS